jgi:syntaxin 1A
MTKDRLPALKAAQNAEDSDPDAAYTAINMEDNSRFMSDFFAHIDSLRTNIDKISELVDEVKRLHSTILAAPQADDRTKEELEEKMGEIKKLANDVRQKLKKIEQDQEQAQASSNKTQAQLRIEKSQLFVLAQKFRDVMNDYNQVQLGYRQKCKERIQRQLEITGRSVTEGEVEEMLESGNPAVFTQGIMVETAQAKQSLADIEARHGDIMKLEKSIRELHDMFIDMAALVQTQGEMIDRIEYNVVQSENFVKAASTDTKKAVKFQSAARRKKILLIVCAIITVIIIVLVLIIYFVTKNKSSDTASQSPATTAGR